MIKLNFIKYIRKIFKDNNMSFEFKDIDVADVEKEISLKTKGKLMEKTIYPIQYN